MLKSVYLATIALSVLAVVEVNAGAWDVGTFDNDAALDFIYEVINGESAEPLSSPFQYVHHSNGYIEADLGARVLVAAEAYAALNGKPSANLPPEFARWLKGR